MSQKLVKSLKEDISKFKISLGESQNFGKENAELRLQIETLTKTEAKLTLEITAFKKDVSEQKQAIIDKNTKIANLEKKISEIEVDPENFAQLEK